PSRLGRDAGAGDAHLEDIVVRRMVEPVLVDLLDAPLDPVQPSVELLGVDGQGHQGPLDAGPDDEVGPVRCCRGHPSPSPAHAADGTRPDRWRGGPATLIAPPRGGAVW